ncbi:pyridine nucleotide-disulphide oxidoreductase family protein [Cutibacterium acnes JCM 18916]|nr:pyridine nucleotide-disulphide oxidoreductase family protein [Cutibacterium acnes JCM 18916]
MTDVPGIFAGGDTVPSERTVTIGVGHGKRAARQIDLWLNRESGYPTAKNTTVGFNDLNLWYFGDHLRRHQPELDPTQRVGFDEVVGGLTDDQPTSKPDDAYPAVTASNVTAATVPALRMPLSSSARATATNSTTTNAPDAPPASTSAQFMLLR